METADVRDEDELTPREQTGWHIIIEQGWKARQERAKNGTILIKAKDQPWEVNPQGRSFFWTHPGLTDRANIDWDVFTSKIYQHTGRHTHQGGLALFIIEGRGYTIIDGERVDWKKGDLLLLPIQPGGVEHQHYNIDDEPSTWIAFVYEPWIHAMGDGLQQSENNPDYQE